MKISFIYLSQIKALRPTIVDDLSILYYVYIHGRILLLSESADWARTGCQLLRNLISVSLWSADWGVWKVILTYQMMGTISSSLVLWSLATSHLCTACNLGTDLCCAVRSWLLLDSRDIEDIDASCIFRILSVFATFC